MMNNTETLVFSAEPSQENKYFFLPFTVPENTETLFLDVDYGEGDKKLGKNGLDVALISPQNRQIGAAGQKYRHIIVSERYSTPGYHTVTPEAGKWRLLIGVASCKKPFAATFTFRFAEKKARWLKGDTHVHTYHSDGAYTPDTVFKKLKKKNLDYAMITDHNGNMTGAYHSFRDKNLLIINGYELTSFNGHVNFWGVRDPLDLPFGFNTLEEYLPLAKQARERGCVVSVNHPTCKKCGWLFWQDPSVTAPEKKNLPDDVLFDCCEVWNGPMRIDNVTAVHWWHEQLLQGKRIPAVGGSDYHQNYVGVNLLACPTTYVYAQSNTTEDVLDAIRKGKSFITHSPTSTQIYLTVDGKMSGETAVLSKKTTAKVTLVHPKRGHKLVVYNNDMIILNATLRGKEEETYEVPVPEKGFVRAEILYNYNFLVKSVYKKVIALLMPKDVGLPIPEFYFALTNPVWVE